MQQNAQLWLAVCSFECLLDAMQLSSSQPDSPSTPSAFSSGIDQDFTLVDDSLKSFNLEGMSSSSHSGSFAHVFESHCLARSGVCPNHATTILVVLYCLRRSV